MYTNIFKENEQILYKGFDFNNVIHIEGFNYHEKKINSQITVNQKTFNFLYDEFTYGLHRVFSKPYTNFIHSGGSLHDIITHNFISTIKLGEILPFNYDVCRIIKDYTDEEKGY